jgi:hypothetical protein
MRGFCDSVTTQPHKICKFMLLSAKIAALCISAGSYMAQW